jgi:hypothetical protein
MQMKIYFILLAVFVLSLSLFSILPGEKIINNIAATPAIGALIVAIYTILRDHSAHIKQLEIQQKQQNFSIGISSHMAQKAFDRHLEFCEKYIAEVHKTSRTLLQEGPTEKATIHGNNLFDLRIEYSTWVTDDISNELIEFEGELYKLSAKVGLSEKTKDPVLAGKANTEAETIWEGLLGALLDKDKPENPNIAIESIINKIRKIIDVKDLVDLRSISIKNATLNITKK